MKKSNTNTITSALALFMFIAIHLGLCSKLNGQSYKYYTQYMFNGLTINPAYAGSNDFITISGDIREQWVGINGAPSTQTISAHAPIMNDQFGLGLIIINDKAGVTSQQDIGVNYSYKLHFINYTLSMGLNVGVNTINTNYNQLLLDNEADEYLQESSNAVLPTIGFGAYLKADAYYVGVSIPQLYRFVHNNYESMSIEPDRLVFITAGYVKQLNSNFTVKPSFLTKSNFGSTFETDLNANFYYKEDYGLGFSYKSLNSISIILEYGYKKTYYIGYSYDIATSSLLWHQSGSHEISFNIYIDRDNKSKVLNPRYF